MKKGFSNFAKEIISMEAMKNVKGGVIHCTYIQCFGDDCFEMSGACAGSDPDACSWYITDLMGGCNV